MRLEIGLTVSALLLTGGAAVPPVQAKVYRVGSGQPYPSLSGLPRLAPGDTVEVGPGTYREFRKWTDSGSPGKPITVRGIGKTRPVIDGTGLRVTGAGPVPRALFQIEGSHVRIENLEFRNARNGMNGAGIRIVGADDTTILNCRLTRCEMGIMSNDNDRLLVEKCEIDHNGNPEHFNGYAHNLYLEGDRTTVRSCWIHDAVAGMNIKSRGHYTELLYNWIADSNEGELSLVDSEKTGAPGSNTVLIGNVIVSKPDRTGNTGKFIDWGQDMGRARNGTLFLFHNTLVAGDNRIQFLSVSAPGAKVEALNNIFYGSPQVVGTNRGGVSGSHNWVPKGATVPDGFVRSVRGADPGFVSLSRRDFRLTSASPCRGAGGADLIYFDADGKSRNGQPIVQMVSPLRVQSRKAASPPDLGALAAPPPSKK